MPLKVERPVELVRTIRIEIGDEFVALDFGRHIPRERAVERARITLESMAGTALVAAEPDA